MKITYYKTADGYIAVTDESPKGFAKILFIGKGGTLDKIVETAFEAHQLSKLTVVDKADVPAEWVTALGYEEPGPEPAPVEEPAAEPVAEEPAEEPPVEIDVTWWPFTRPAAAPKKLTTAEERQANLIVLAVVLLGVLIAFFRM